MTELGTDWRTVGGTATAWFDAPTPAAAAALADRVLTISAEALVDLRPTGVRVRLGTDEHTASISDAARELGSAAGPGALQQLGVVIESVDPARVTAFWQPVLGYDRVRDSGLEDPLRRDPSIRVDPVAEPRLPRDRLHLDVVRPAAVVAEVTPGEAGGPYGVRHADPDGNEVDLVPGDPLGGTDVSDWQSVFGAMVSYRTTSQEQQRGLCSAIADLAHDAGFPVLVDVRPGLVVVDSGKDQAEPDVAGPDLDFPGLAGRIQAAARGLGATADPGLPRLVQLFLDAVDVEALRAFWAAALGYVHDQRAGVSDIHDLRRLGPVMVFQEIDASDEARRRHRNRLHVELAVPADVAGTRLAAAVGAGGRVVEESQARWRVLDPEGNELVVVAD